MFDNCPLCGCKLKLKEGNNSYFNALFICEDKSRLDHFCISEEGYIRITLTDLSAFGYIIENKIVKISNPITFEKEQISLDEFIKKYKRLYDLEVFR